MDNMEIRRSAVEDEQQALAREAQVHEVELAEREAAEAKAAADKAKADLGQHLREAQKRAVEISMAAAADADSLSVDGLEEERHLARQTQLANDVDREGALQAEFVRRQRLADEAVDRRAIVDKRIEERDLEAYVDPAIDAESMQRLRAGAERDAAEAVEAARVAQVELGEHQRAAQAHLESAADLEASRQAAYQQGPEVWEKERDAAEARNRAWQDQAYEHIDRERDLELERDRRQTEAEKAIARRDRVEARAEAIEPDSPTEAQERTAARQEAEAAERHGKKVERAEKSAASIGAPGSFQSAAHLSAVASNEASERDRGSREFLKRQDVLHQELMTARAEAVDASRTPDLERREQTEARVVEARDALALDRERHLAQRAEWLSTQEVAVGKEAAVRFAGEAKAHRAEVTRLEALPQQRVQARELAKTQAQQAQRQAESTAAVGRVQTVLDEGRQAQAGMAPTVNQSGLSEVQLPASSAFTRLQAERQTNAQDYARKQATKAEQGVRPGPETAMGKAVAARVERDRQQNAKEASKAARPQLSTEGRAYWDGVEAKGLALKAEKAQEVEQAQSQTQEQARAKENDKELTR